MKFQPAFSLAAAGQTAIAQSSNFVQNCAALPASLRAANTTIYISQYLSAGTIFEVPDRNETCGSGAPGTPPGGAIASTDLCRVTGYTATSERSGINWETWLPMNWTGRFISHGNGGLSGCISYNDLDYSSSLGFAAVSANSGHNGTSGGAFYNNREVFKDFVWRSLHTGVVVGKEITKKFYGKPHTKSYYLGCSTGGRQGFKAVQDWPEDFDGVVAGAPAIAMNNLTSWSGSFLLISGPVGSPGYISAQQWQIVDRDILNQCDLLDGAKDNVIEDPSRCSYDPSGMLCSRDHSANCLTAAQIGTVRKIFSPLIQKDGSLIYPRSEPGSGFSPLLSGQPFPYTVDWYRYVIYNDPHWDPLKLTLEDMAYAARLNVEGSETWNGDLSAFQKRGSKVIHYHGHADFLISSGNSARYYHHVQNTMKLNSAQLDDFYRYFPISGMTHCQGGAGAWNFGQAKSSVTALDPEENVLLALVRWVEQGVPPTTLKGTKYNNDTKAAGVKIQRKHCKYPARNEFSGKGDFNDPASWRCVD